MWCGLPIKRHWRLTVRRIIHMQQREKNVLRCVTFLSFLKTFILNSCYIVSYHYSSWCHISPSTYYLPSRKFIAMLLFPHHPPYHHPHPTHSYPSGFYSFRLLVGTPTPCASLVQRRHRASAETVYRYAKSVAELKCGHKMRGLNYITPSGTSTHMQVWHPQRISVSIHFLLTL
jgi:hypothetical protein